VQAVTAIFILAVQVQLELEHHLERVAVVLDIPAQELLHLQTPGATAVRAVAVVAGEITPQAVLAVTA
jgi:hypothetical protein